jgi:DnaJ domain
MSINPYELFGIDPHKSTIKELKKKYYEFALMVHPDRNNTQNGDEMYMVHCAYKYCLEQLENAKNKETTFETLEKDFDTFCKEQKEVPPAFRDILEDALELQKFNAAFEQSEGYKATYTGGYGNFMEPSEYNSSLDNSNITKVDYDDTENKPISNDFSSLVVYKEPINFSAGQDYLDYTKEEPIDSYTVYIKKLCLSDYKEANTNEKLEDDGKTRTYEDIVKEREQLSNDYTMKRYEIVTKEREEIDKPNNV